MDTRAAQSEEGGDRPNLNSLLFLGVISHSSQPCRDTSKDRKEKICTALILVLNILLCRQVLLWASKQISLNC